MQKQMHTAIKTATIILQGIHCLHAYLSRTFLRLTLLVSLWMVGNRFPRNDILLRLFLSRRFCCRRLDWELKALLSIISLLQFYSKYESAIRTEFVVAFISFNSNWVSISSWFLHRTTPRFLHFFITTRKQLHSCHLPWGILLFHQATLTSLLKWDESCYSALKIRRETSEITMDHHSHSNYCSLVCQPSCVRKQLHLP